MKRMLKKIRKEEGQGLVEFALLLPIFLLLVLGMMEYGWMLNAKITVNSAAKEVARTAVVADGRTIEEKVAEAKSRLDISPVTIVANTSATSGQALVVTVSTEVTPLVGFFFHDAQTISSQATMRVE